jgi:hypothetical protein
MTYQQKGNEDGREYTLAKITFLLAKFLPYGDASPMGQKKSVPCIPLLTRTG